MATRSLFERQLSPALREIGFSVKIPDANASRKPFDYVVGVESGGRLGFNGIEAKKADGWSLSQSKWYPHQRDALSVLSNIDEDSAWVAIGFLDIPRMKLDWNRSRITKRMARAAFLLRWVDFLKVEHSGSCKYIDLISIYPETELEWGKIPGRTRNSWIVRKTHKILG